MWKREEKGIGREAGEVPVVASSESVHSNEVVVERGELLRLACPPNIFGRFRSS